MGTGPKPVEKLTTHEKEMLAALKAIQFRPSNTVQFSTEVATLQTKVDKKDSTTKGCHLANATMSGQADQGRNRDHHDSPYPVVPEMSGSKPS